MRRIVRCTVVVLLAAVVVLVPFVVLAADGGSVVSKGRQPGAGRLLAIVVATAMVATDVSVLASFVVGSRLARVASSTEVPAAVELGARRSPDRTEDDQEVAGL